MKPITISTKPLVRPKVPQVRLRAPNPLPLRPLPADSFRAPRGQRQIFLPNFTITFLHTPLQDPHFASFLVPLWFSKLDLKDYLYNLYGVKALRIRSYVIQSPVREGKERDIKPGRNNWFRPASKKKMMIEMVRDEAGQGPFVWPEEPKDWRPWGKTEFETATRDHEKSMKRRQDLTAWPEDLGPIKQQAANVMREAKEKALASAGGVG